MFDVIIDRLLGLLPLGVLAYVIRQHAGERQKLLEALERNSAHSRDRERELLNRITHPHAMPTGSRPVGPVERLAHRDEAAAAMAQVRSERQAVAARNAPTDKGPWNGVGSVSRSFFPLPTDNDDIESE